MTTDKRYRTDTVLTMIEAARKHPLSCNDQDFLGNIYKRLCQDTPIITDKQMAYLGNLTRKPTARRVLVIQSGTPQEFEGEKNA